MQEEIYMSLERKHLVMLLQNGLSQKEIAQRVGTTQPHVSIWMNGIRFPTSENLIKLSQALNIEPTNLTEKLIQISEMNNGNNYIG
jgi:transcriptional regulator with XRE-family HTH domain